MTHIEQHLLDEVLVFANLIQIPVVILTGGADKPRRLSRGSGSNGTESSIQVSPLSPTAEFDPMQTVRQNAE